MVLVPSRLRESVSYEETVFEPFFSIETPKTLQPKIATVTAGSKMTLTQTYYLAHSARSKLSSEASRSDHDLRLLVGHANLLDELTLQLQEAERSSDTWFEATVNAARQRAEDAASNEAALDEDLDMLDADEDFSDDSEEEELYVTRTEDNTFAINLAPKSANKEIPSIPTPAPFEKTILPGDSLDSGFDDDSDMDDDYDSTTDADDNNDEEMFGVDLGLQRTRSRSSGSSPPDLVVDHSSDDSGEESDEEVPESSPTIPQSPKFSLDANSGAVAQKQFNVDGKPMHQALEEYGFYIPHLRGRTPAVINS